MNEFESEINVFQAKMESMHAFGLLVVFGAKITAAQLL